MHDDFASKKRNKFLAKILIISVGIAAGIIAFLFLKTPAFMAMGIYNIDPRWGLGKNETAYVSCDREYEWYVDKGNSGMHSKTNSGPACAVMAAKWANENFDDEFIDDKYWAKNAVVKARHNCKETGKLWKKEDIQNYLDEHDVDYEVFNEVDEEMMKEKLEQGNILVLCIDSRYLEYAPQKVKFYQTRVGQLFLGKSRYYIIVKGYRIVDDNLFFETYDSTSNSTNYYKSDQLIGKNRYYRAENLLYTMKQKWDGFIMVKGQEDK